MDDLHCYACTAPATTKCVICEALSCAFHLRSLRGGHGYYLVCRDCYSRSKRSQVLTLLVGLPLMLLGMYIVWSFFASGGGVGPR